VARSTSGFACRFELREQFALGLQILEDRLDDDVRLPAPSPATSGSTGRARPNYGFVAQPAFEKLGRAFHRRRQGARDWSCSVTVRPRIAHQAAISPP